jgi:hypothetical protein
MNVGILSSSDWPNRKKFSGNEDSLYAFDRFIGKTEREAVELLRNSPTSYAEDISYFDGAVFLYYFKSWLNYLLSEESEEDFSTALVFARFYLSREKKILSLFEPEIDELKVTLSNIAKRKSFYDADDEDFDKYIEAVKI